MECPDITETYRDRQQDEKFECGAHVIAPSDVEPTFEWLLNGVSFGNGIVTNEGDRLVLIP